MTRDWWGLDPEPEQIPRIERAEADYREASKRQLEQGATVGELLIALFCHIRELFVRMKGPQFFVPFLLARAELAKEAEERMRDDDDPPPPTVN